MKTRKNFDDNSQIHNSTKKESWIAFFILCIIVVIALVPLVWIVISSFKIDAEINKAGGFMFLPKTWTLRNYKEILAFSNKQLPVYNWFLNSIIVSGSQTIIAVIIYAMSAYAYAKLKFKGRDIIFLGIMFLSSFPAITNIIPLYKLMHSFGWLNELIALIIPGLAGVLNIFLIRQFMYAIPDVILESARIDGAKEWRIFTRIILPNCKPILIAVGLFTFTGSWNDFLWPSIVINNIDRLTLTAGLQLAKGVYGNQVARMCTIATIAIIPMIILYLFTQKYFVKGISLDSGVKG
jgi:multiple sugar transport system permease protein